MFTFFMYLLYKCGIIWGFFLIYCIFFFTFLGLHRYYVIKTSIILKKETVNFEKKIFNFDEKLVIWDTFRDESFLTLQVQSFQLELKKWYFNQKNFNYTQVSAVIELFFNLDKFMRLKSCHSSADDLCKNLCNFQKIMHKNFNYSFDDYINTVIITCSKINKIDDVIQ